MTGCRLDEVEGLLKTEVDTVGMALRLGDSKTGKSIRPVGSAVITVLKTAMAKSKSKYVFPAVTTDAKHHTGLTRWLKKVAAKEVPGITSHGLRHSFSSTAEDLSYTLPTIEGYRHRTDEYVPVVINVIAPEYFRSSRFRSCWDGSSRRRTRQAP